MEKELSRIRKAVENMHQLMETLVALQKDNHQCCRAVDLPVAQTTAQQMMADRLAEIAANTKPLMASPLLVQRKIYKQETIKLLGISERTYDRHKAKGLLKPHGIGQDFYYPEDLEKAMEESRKKGRV
ncbi:helix-turn-helix domain-containing protein [Parapedobacter tibetensis]|uniref:helix-turn-helix domain-containing protein n=1 Tax=Parapedobacter tibetensis TaxID=2972951 RepID=UPI00214D6FF1|nr:helix-turn-helix domain-containing protein [Parapedobacter tibetensis]